MAAGGNLQNEIGELSLHDNVLSFDGHGRQLNTESDVQYMVNTIKQATACRTLILRGNSFGVAAAEALSEALAERHDLKRAVFSDMFTGRSLSELPVALRHIIRGLQLSRAELVELDLSDNAFGQIGAAELELYLESSFCCSLEVLRLNNNGLGSVGSTTIANALLRCARNAAQRGDHMNLKTIVIGRNRLENEGAVSIASLIEFVKTMEEIELPQNGIRDVGMKALARAFRFNPKLRVINVSDNVCTGDAAFAMASSLQLLHDLEVLNMDQCLLRNDGAISVAYAIKEHRNLKELRFCGNELNASVAVEILDYLKNMQKLQLIDLNENQFGEHGIIMIKSIGSRLNMVDQLGHFSSDEGEADEVDEAYVEQEKERMEPHFSDEKITIFLNTIFYEVTNKELKELLDGAFMKTLLDVLKDYEYPRRIARVFVSTACGAHNTTSLDLKNVGLVFCESLLKIGFGHRIGIDRFTHMLLSEMRILPHTGIFIYDDVSGAFWVMEKFSKKDVLPVSVILQMKKNMNKENNDVGELASALYDTLDEVLNR